MSAWTRTIVVPLSIMSAFKPVRRLDPEQGIAELFREDLPRHPARRTRQPVSWTNIFLGLDRLLKWADRRLPRVLARAGHPGGAPLDASSTSRTPTASARSSRR